MKILIGTEVLEENSPKMSPKIPPKAPQEDLDMEKNSAVTPKGTTGTSVQNFKYHVKRFSKSRHNIPK